MKAGQARANSVDIRRDRQRSFVNVLACIRNKGSAALGLARHEIALKVVAKSLHDSHLPFTIYNNHPNPTTNPHLIIEDLDAYPRDTKQDFGSSHEISRLGYGSQRWGGQAAEGGLVPYPTPTKESHGQQSLQSISTGVPPGSCALVDRTASPSMSLQ